MPVPCGPSASMSAGGGCLGRDAGEHRLSCCGSVTCSQPGQEGCWRNEKQRLLSCWPEPTGVLAPLKVTCVPCFVCVQRDHQQSLCPDLPDLLVPWVPQDLQGRQVSLFSYSSPNQQQAVDTMDSRHICSNPDTEGRDYGEKARAYKGEAQCCTRHLLRR